MNHGPQLGVAGPSRADSCGDSPGVKTVDELGIRSPEECRELQEQVDLKILHKDKHIIVVVKPPGLNTAPGHKLLTGSQEPPDSGGAEAQTKTDTDKVAPEVATAACENEAEGQGRPKKRRHQEMWQDAVEEVAVMTLPEDRKHLQQHVEKLSAVGAVPRKRRVFQSWGRRCLKLDDEAELDAIFALCQETFERREGRRMDAVTTRLLRVLRDVKAVHRLDCETSGVLVLALTVEAARGLSEQFRDKGVEKEYVAQVLGGRFKEESGEVSLPIRADEDDRPRQIVDHVGGKPCRTLYRVLEHDEATGTSRVALVPYTGRTHQLRLHMASLGHPLVGDTLYNPEVRERLAGQEYNPGLVRLHLHAEKLRFTHPISNQRLEFEATAPF